MPRAARRRLGDPPSSASRSRSSLGAARAPVLLALLAGGTLVRCDCGDDPISFEARPTLDPEVLPFGPTNVATEASLVIEVFNAGNAGYQIIDYQVNGSDKFTVTPSDDLVAGLVPGGTSTITVTYRPCPEAWTGDQLDTSYDLTECPGELEAGTLVLTDNSPAQTRSIALSGQPVQPPNGRFRCVQAEGVCNMPDAQRSQCVALQFGDVRAGSGMPCDLYLELVNENRTDGTNEIPVAPLVVEGAEILVKNQDGATAEPPIVRGENAGFSFLTGSGDPLTFPFELAVPEGSTSASRLVRVRFDGQSGTWFGSADMGGLGLRVFTNDPGGRTRTFTVIAYGTSPNLEVIPDLVDFGQVQQGRTVTATVSVRNQGNAQLTLTSAALRSPNPEFAFEAADGLPVAPRTLEPSTRFDLYVRYTPSDPANDREFFEIASDDPDEGTFAVEVRGGPTPQFCFSPPGGVLEFPIPDPPTGEPRTREVSLESCGTGRLSITGLDIQNAGNPASLDDFRIDLPECSTLPCSPSIELCPENDPGCTIDGMPPGVVFAVPIVYQNNDTSTQDLANLVVSTNDPSLPEQTIALSASDNPCLPPTVGIEVVNDNPCVPEAVELRLVGDPGGPLGGTATFAFCDWQLRFAPTTPDIFVPDESLEACTSTELVPRAPGGFHLVAVTARNSCGAEATSSPERINVAPNCN